MNKKCIIPCLLFINPSFASEDDCFNSTVMSPSPFMGNVGETLKLSNGTFWRVKNSFEFFYEYYPQVTICPSRGYLILKDIKVEIVSGR